MTPSAVPLAIFFDFDGTLVDTLPGLVLSVNHIRDCNGLQAVDRSTVRCWIGGGIEVLLRAAVEGRTVVDHALREAFLRHYLGAPLQDAPPFPGVVAMLDRLADLPLALVTNKARPSVDLLLSRLNWRHRFVAVVTPDDAGARKPDAAFMRFALARMPAAQAGVLIGDSEFDVAAARAAGMRAAVVGWGYRTRAELAVAAADDWFDHPEDITMARLMPGAEVAA